AGRYRGKTAMKGREPSGRFGVGNPGGPGRPRRGPERPYLDTVAEVVTLDDWRDIVSRAKADALAGNAKAREWLGKYLAGDDPLALIQLLDELETLKLAARGTDHACILPPRLDPPGIGGAPGELPAGGVR